MLKFHFARIRHRLLMLVALALGLALFSQYQFTRSNEPSLLAVSLFGLACVGLVVAERMARDAPEYQLPAEDGPSPPEQAADDAPPQVALWRWGLTAVALTLSAVALWQFYHYPQIREASGPALSWGVSCLLMAVAWIKPPGKTTLVWLVAHRGEALAVGAVTLLALGARVWGLGSGPFTLSGDEGSIGLEVRQVLQGNLRNPFLIGMGLPLPTMSFFVQAIPAWFASLNAWTLRLPSAIFGALAIPALYLLARQIFDRHVALAAALMLAGYQAHVHYSRVAINVVFDTFFYPAALAALVYGLQQRQKTWAFALAGFCIGATQYANVGARLLPLLILAFLLALVVIAPQWLRGQWPNLLLLVGTAMVVAGPLLMFAMLRPDDYNARLNQIGIFQSGWIEQEQIIRNQGKLPILFDQFQRTLFGFNIYHDRTVSYNPDGPMAGPPMALLLFLGLGLSLWRWRQPVYTLLSLWFWAVLLTGGVLTVNPPTSNRLAVLLPVVALLAAVALVACVRLLLVALGQPARGRWALGAILSIALAVALLDIRFYFQRYLPSHVFGGSEALVATQLGYDLAAQSPAATLYFFGPPRMWSGFSTLVFLAPQVERTDMSEPVTAATVAQQIAPLTGETIFVFLPERSAELDLVRRRFPGGEEHVVPAPMDSNPLYLVYRLLPK